MHLLGETYFSHFSISYVLQNFVMFKPLLILDSMDKIAKQFRCCCYINYLK